ncbi:unnamed protein product [Absidia cylindrospora]
MASVEVLQTLVLQTLDKENVIENSKDMVTSDNQPVEQLTLLGALNSLKSKDVQGQQVAEQGSHEARVFEAVPTGDEGIAMTEVQAKLGDAAKIGQGKAFKTNGFPKKAAQGTLEDAKLLTELKKRKLVDKQKLTSFKIVKGPEFSLEIKKEATDITYEMLQSGEWKNASFKKYNFDAAGVHPNGGHLHPLMKVRQEFREIFFEMGFEEMPTNCFAESSFWNFDALFQPQQHPARDAHDTFFLKDPATTDRFPMELMKKIKETHENGGDTGSIGYNYNWKQDDAGKMLLRTHTTAVSSYMLYKLAEQTKAQGFFKPAKYFSIDRVFRNESVDATHLAEFHQIEGVIADKNLTLGNLIGFMDVFFKKMGMDKIRFKPTYNPYTEPSMEIFSYHEGLKKWVEIGNSGLFRPEMLGPLGLPSDVRVVAWGLGLERPTMVKYGINNIRDLLGHKVNISMIKEYPVCRLDKKMGKELIGLSQD